MHSTTPNSQLNRQILQAPQFAAQLRVAVWICHTNTFGVDHWIPISDLHRR
jgi:hypothetical protein